jgi:hypothetical protein
MTQENKTSFIPKKGLHDEIKHGPDSYVKRRDVRGSGFYITLLLFLCTVFATIGVFLYSLILVESIEDQEKALRNSYDSFEIETVENFIRRDVRLKNITKLLNNHIATSELFLQLQDITLPSVTYEKLQYRVDIEGRFELIVTAVTDSFDSVALQMDQFTNDVDFRSPVLTTMSITEDKKVRFGVAVGISHDLVSYKRSIGITNSTHNNQ